jgi:hypothetical protein
VPDTVDNRFDGADERVTAQAQANDFATDCIFLISESQGHEGSPVEVGLEGGWGQDSTGANIESDVLETKGGAVGRRRSIFAGSTEEEEGHAEHIDNNEGFRSAVLEGKVGCMVNDGYRYGLDAIGRRIGARVATELTAEAEFCVSGGSQPRVRGPHARKGLTHGTEGLLH